MTVRVGVIGTGMIGQDHIRRMTRALAGVRVTAVTDVDADTAAAVAARVPGATVHSTGEDLIADDMVDAVVVCSWGPTHEQYVLASIAAGKPVFCEKPLATTQQACRRIIEAEVAHGSRLVQVGYMRRYDVAYRALKRVVDSGDIGAPLMMHCAHRNPSVPPYYEKESAITDTAVHEIDMVRWMFDDEIAAARVLVPRKSRNGGDLQDPLFLLLEMASGTLVDVEISVNIRYGYDIRGEVVGEDGTAALGELSPVSVRRAGQVSTPVPADWRERFIRAYDVEFQEWIDAIAAGGTPLGPSAWDGYAAAVVSDAGVAALRTGERVEVSLIERPKLYAEGVAT
ncbi:MAG TPA: Gfo/Idh/MocA family oxidoreductase [Actinoplanes sp.]|nr:Gfo/Idh/MocA family oxidoreductase [Actinoplanes sp.]